MVPPHVPALRFQRTELREMADLSPAALACLDTAKGPADLIAALGQRDDASDAVNALAQILPHRQSVWWACLALRLLPDLDDRPAEWLAVECAENWVQTKDPTAALRARAAADNCAPDRAAHWVAMATHWCGPSIAPPENQNVPPAPHLTGIAVRTALLFLRYEPALHGKIGAAELLEIGMALMAGDFGRNAQLALRDRIASVS